MKLLCGSALLIGVSGFGGTTETLPPTLVMPMTPPTPQPVIFPPIFPPTAAPEIILPPTMAPEIIWPPTMAPEIIWPPTMAPEIIWPTMAPEIVWPPVVVPVLPQPVVTDVTGRTCAGKCFQSQGREGLPVLESYQEYTIVEGPEGAIFQVRSMCSCDTECERFGDCCNDYTAVCLAGVATGGEWDWSGSMTGTTEPAGEWVVSATGELVWSTDAQSAVVSETGQWVQSANGEFVWVSVTSTDAQSVESSSEWNTGTMSTGGEWSSTQAAGQFVQDASGEWVWTTTESMYPGVISSETVYPGMTETFQMGSAVQQPAGQFIQSATGEWVWSGEGEVVGATTQTFSTPDQSTVDAGWIWTPAAASSMRKAGTSGFLRGKRTEANPVVATTIVSAGDNVNYVCQNKRAIMGEADKGTFERFVDPIKCEQKCSVDWGCQSYTFGSGGYCELWSIPDTSMASIGHKMCNKGDDGSFVCQMNRAIEGRGQLQNFEVGFSEQRCQLACKNDEECKSFVWGQGSCKLWRIHEYSVDHDEFTTCSKK